VGAKNKAELRHDVRHDHQLTSTLHLDSTSSKSVVQQLEDLIRLHGLRVRDVFADWDSESVGTVDLAHFRTGLKAMSFDGGDEVINEAFNEINASKSGNIDLHELEHALHRYLDKEHYEDHALAHGFNDEAKQNRRGSLERVWRAVRSSGSWTGKPKHKSRPQEMTLSAAKSLLKQGKGPLAKQTPAEKRRRRTLDLMPWRFQGPRISSWKGFGKSQDRPSHVGAPTTLFNGGGTDKLAGAVDALAMSDEPPPPADDESHAGATDALAALDEGDVDDDDDDDAALAPRKSRSSVADKDTDAALAPRRSAPDTDGDAPLAPCNSAADKARNNFSYQQGPDAVDESA